MDTEKLILDALKKGDMTIQNVSIALNIHRITATKYLSILEAKKQIRCRMIGRAKLYAVKK